MQPKTSFLSLKEPFHHHFRVAKPDIQHISQCIINQPLSEEAIQQFKNIINIRLPSLQNKYMWIWLFQSRLLSTRLYFLNTSCKSLSQQISYLSNIRWPSNQLSFYLTSRISPFHHYHLHFHHYYQAKGTCIKIIK